MKRLSSEWGLEGDHGGHLGILERWGFVQRLDVWVEDCLERLP